MKQSETHFISINPNMFNEQGHNYIYNLCLQAITKRNQWDFSAVIPKCATLPNLPKEWDRGLYIFPSRYVLNALAQKQFKGPRKYQRFFRKIAYPISFFSSLKKQCNNTQKRKILFFESTSADNLKQLDNSLRFLSKKNVRLWLIYRYHPDLLPQQSHETRFFLNRLKKKLGNENIILFTDSELLLNPLTSFFACKTHLLPIPHVEDIQVMKSQSDSNRVYCWWPAFVREGKGLSVIKQMCQLQNKAAQNLTIVAGKSSELISSANSPTVHLIKDHLSREEYLSWLYKCDLLLLPYTDPSYRFSTSGIFVEGIMAQKPCFVADETWMDEELRKHHLPELILNFEEADVAERLLSLYQNAHVQEKIQIMQRHYARFHSSQTYADKLKLALSF